MCPFCAANIEIEAVVCRFCGRELRGVDQPPASMDRESFHSQQLQSKPAQAGVRPQSSIGNWGKWAVLSIVVPLVFGLPLIIQYFAGATLEEPALISGILAVLSILIVIGFWLMKFQEGRPTRPMSHAENVAAGWGCLAMCLLAVVGFLFLASETNVRKPAERAAKQTKQTADEQRREEDRDRAGAWVAAMELVQRRLKSPGSADFPGLHEVTVQSQGNGRFYVVAWVDAQNSYGALIRTHFSCTIRKGDGKWMLEDLDMQE